MSDLWSPTTTPLLSVWTGTEAGVRRRAVCGPRCVLGWCSSCRTFEHYSALVPEWWRSHLTVDESELTALPDVLESAVQRKSSI